MRYQDMVARPHWIYRCYDAAGNLLYIGATGNLKERMSKHRCPSAARRIYPAGSLWEQMARWTSEQFPDRVTALAAERAAIREERPLLNRTNNRTH